MKYAFIQQQRPDYSLVRLCSALRVSRSGYYAWRQRPLSIRQRANEGLLQAIQRIHVQSKGCYGILKCWQQLKREGMDCGRARIAKLRQAHGIYAKRRQRFVVTTRSKHRYWIAPNRLKRDFTANQPNRVWVGDVTFIATRSGWLYLAVLLDLYSRKVVGWSMSASNNGPLVEEALKMAIEQRKPKPGLIHHTDRGSTYATQSYRDLLAQHGMVSSMSRKKDCWDNAVAESFFATLKNELTHDKTFNTREEARTAIFEYMEIFYNRQRLHQTLNYQTPEQYELMYDAA